MRMSRRQGRSRRNRGTVIVLVVAVLALLAVMGTAYLVSSRTDRKTTRAMSDNRNMDLARDAVMNQIRAQMYAATLRPSDGVLLGIPDIWKPGVAYKQQVGTAPGPVTPPSFVMGTDYQIYKCILDHISSLDVDGPPPEPKPPAKLAANLKWAITIPSDTPGGPNSARWYDYRDVPVNASSAIDFSRSPLDPAIPSEPWLARDFTPAPPTATDGDFTLLARDRFLPATPGAPVLPSGNNPPTGSGDVAVLDSINGTLDGIWYMLPINSASGIRYRYAVRIVDTSRMANLNTGWCGTPNPPNTTIDPFGQSLCSFQLCNNVNHSPALFSDVAALGPQLQTGLGTGVLGRGPTVSPATPLEWQNRCLGYERNGINPAVGSMTAPLATWFDLADELELHAYGLRTAGYTARPAAIWSVSSLAPYNPALPMNFGQTQTTKRRLFTTYSFDRTLSAAFASNANRTFTATYLPAAGGAVVTLDPLDRAVPLMRNSCRDQGVAMLSWQVAVRNGLALANQMAAVGYPTDECMAVMVNFLAQSRAARTGVSLSGGTLTIAGDTAATMEGQVTLGGAPNRTYLGYSAQPFLNEIAINAAPNGTTVDNNDFAVELFNPYTAPITLNKWVIRINGTAWHTFSALDSIPAGGYLVVAKGTTLFGTPTIASASIVIPSNTSVTLDRPYYDGADKFMTVDRISYNFGTNPSYPIASAGAPVKITCERPNCTAAGGTTPTQTTAGGADKWMCTASTPSLYVASTTPSLGAINSSNAKGDLNYFGIRLVYRFKDLVAPDLWPGINATTAESDALVRTNVGDLQCYARVCNISDAGNPVPITEQLGNTATVLPKAVSSSTCYQEARVRFDYLADTRAQRMLMNVTMVDRACDGYDQLGAGMADSSDEVRIPGRINVNTANPQVLDGVLSNFVGSVSSQVSVGMIVAYRDRVVRTSLAYTSYKGAGPAGDFRDTTSFPGMGIRSLGELMIPLGIADGKVTVTASSKVACPNILAATAPDQTWTKMFGACTVRSDTFLVYGYMEAIKAHPKYTTHNNGTDWYLAATDLPTENIGTPNLRVANRRWMAVVDRSWCNALRSDTTNFVLPKVVAIKDMPR